jgi:hypothetical protein
MNRAASSFPISLAALTLTAAALTTASLAQSPTQSPTTFPLITPSTSCPVDLSAQPGVGPGMIVVIAGKDNASQKLDLQLSNSRDARAVTHAQITVHGFTVHGRIPPASNPNPATIAKQVDLQLTVAPGASTSTGLLFKGFTSVRWIDLDSLTYADGSTWHTSPQHNCQVVPSLLMLVAHH